LYYKDNAGAVQLLSTSTTATGTANGVLYLNGSKVATSGSALVFDGTNLGIGVASPTLRLQVAVSGATTTFDGLNVTNGTAQYRLGLTGASYSYAGAGANETWLYSAGTTPLTLGPDGNAPIKFVTNGSERMRLTSTGLGIGTTSPGYKLDAQQSSAGTLARFYSTGGTDANILIRNNTQTAQIGADNTQSYLLNTGAYPWTIWTNSTERMRVDSSGNLGIATTSPTQKLDVNGNIRTTGEVALSGSDFVYSWAGGTTGQRRSGFYLDGVNNVLRMYTNTAEAARIDSSGNLGIGTTSPSNYTNFKTLEIGAGGGTKGGLLRISGASNTVIGYFYADSLAPLLTIGSDTSTALSFVTGATERARIDSSGNLGIGTSSLLTKFTVQDTERFELGGGSGFTYAQSVNAARTATVEHRSYGSFLTWGTGAAGSQAERMRLDSSGNLGLGVTPSAWGSPNVPAFDIGSYGSLYAANGVFGVGTASNAYFNGTNWIYKSSQYAQVYYHGGGNHVWFTAASGTAGNAISFTQAMTLDASGNLGVGTTSPAQKLDVLGSIAVRASTSGANQDVVALRGLNSDNTAYANALYYANSHRWSYSGATEGMRLDSSGNLLVGTTSQITGEKFAADTTGASAKAITARNNAGSGAATIFVWNSATSGDNLFIGFGTEANGSQRGSISYNRTAGLVAYNITSDYRAKDIIGPVQNSGALIDSVPVYMGKMKGATQERPMFIAHETPAYAHTGEKDAVDADGNPVYQQMDASALIPVMWAEIQSLRARVAQLEAKGA
jgi:hypothetical protein